MAAIRHLDWRLWDRIEGHRPKWAKYCKVCGISRSREWKRENPERVKLYGNQDVKPIRRKLTDNLKEAK